MRSIHVLTRGLGRALVAATLLAGCLDGADDEAAPAPVATSDDDAIATSPSSPLSPLSPAARTAPDGECTTAAAPRPEPANVASPDPTRRLGAAAKAALARPAAPAFTPPPFAR